MISMIRRMAAQMLWKHVSITQWRRWKHNKTQNDREKLRRPVAFDAKTCHTVLGQKRIPVNSQRVLSTLFPAVSCQTTKQIFRLWDDGWRSKVSQHLSTNVAGPTDKFRIEDYSTIFGADHDNFHIKENYILHQRVTDWKLSHKYCGTRSARH